MSDSLSLGTPTAQTITFNQIPATLRDPRNVAEIRPNYGAIGLQLLPSKALIIGQMLPVAAGVPAATPNAVYPITGPGQAEVLFGAGSVAATMVNAWRLNNTTTPLFAAGVPDVAGAVKASVALDIGAASFSGGFSCTLWGGTVFQAPIVIPAGTVQSDLASAIIAAVTAMPALPFTAALAAGSTSNVLLTAKHAGLVGNDIPILITDRSDASAPQVAITLGGQPASSSVATNLAGGLGNPSLATVITNAAGTWFTDIVQPWYDTTNVDAFQAELVRRYGALVNLDARGYLEIGGSYTTVVNFGDASDCIQTVTWGTRGAVDPLWSRSAAKAAIHAFRLGNDPSRQSKGIAILGITAPPAAEIWSGEERDLLLHNGISTTTALSDGTEVISRTVTGYLQSTLGVADAAWLDVMTPATMTAIRYDWLNYVSLVYPQAKLFQDGSVGAEYDDTAATPRRVAGSWAKRCTDYEQAGWIENSAGTVQSPSSIFQINASDPNRLDGQTAVQIVGNLMISATVMEFLAQ